MPLPRPNPNDLKSNLEQKYKEFKEISDANLLKREETRKIGRKLSNMRSLLSQANKAWEEQRILGTIEVQHETIKIKEEIKNLEKLYYKSRREDNERAEELKEKRKELEEVMQSGKKSNPIQNRQWIFTQHYPIENRQWVFTKHSTPD